ncbi:MAG TPA: peptide ABC transporter substrate-binding protein [Salinarimonas sp.]|nr:peptide ABC transporter substrate-binding protein [Salinarimonas sp.]
MNAWFKRAAVALVATLALAGASAAQVVYNRGNDADPETLDPQKTSTTYEDHVLRDMYEGLMIYDAAARVVPGAASAVEASPDGRVYRFTLREGARWSNGDPVTAGDFVYSLRRIMNPATGAKYANILYPILNAERINKGGAGARPEDLGVRAVDERVLEITLERPTPYFLELLTHQTGFPVHPPSVERHGAAFTRPENAVSNGAYVLKEWVPNSHIRLEKNPRFHDAANVRIDVVNVLPHRDLGAAARRFMAGELHSTSDLPADQLKSLRERLGDQVRISPRLGTWYLAVNTAKAPLDDVRVRQALSMTIDREFIADTIWNGAYLPAYSFVPPGVGNYGEPAHAAFKDLSPIDREERARALLKEAGYGPGAKPLRVEIRYNTTDNNKNTVVAIGDMWKAIGVETAFVNTDAKTHFAHLREGGDFDVARAGWIADYSDPQNFLFLLLSDNRGFNYARYRNPDFDALLRRADAEPDLAKRAAILLEAERMVTRDQPYIPVLTYANNNLVSRKLEGWVENARGTHPTRFMAIRP